MADINFDDFIRQLEESSRGLSSLNESVRGSMGSLSTGSSLAAAELRREAAVRKQAAEQLRKDFKDLGTDLASSMRGITAGNSGFSQLGNVAASATQAMTGFASGLVRLIPILGDGLGKMVDTIGGVSKDIIQAATQQFETGYEAFRQASKIGAVNSFEEIRDAGSRLKLRMEDLAGVITQNSDNLIALGGNSAKGTRALTDLFESSGELRREFLKLGTSAEELMNIQANMAGSFARAGFSLKDIDRVQKDYLINLDAVSQLTGKSKDQLQKERSARESEFRFMARMKKIAGEDPKQFENLQKIFDVLGTALAPEDFKAVMAQFGTEGRILDKSMAADVVRNPAIRQLVAAITGGADVDEIQRMAKTTSQAGLARMEPYAAISSQLPFGYQSSDIYRAAGRPFAGFGESKADREKSRKETETTNANLAKVVDEMKLSSVNLQQAATHLDSVTKVLEKLSGSIHYLTTKITDMITSKPSTGTVVTSGQSSPGVGPMTPITTPGGAAVGMYPSSGKRSSTTSTTTITDDMTLPSIPSGLGVNGRHGADKPIKKALQEKLSKIAEQFPGATITGLNDSDFTDRSGSPHALGEAVDFIISDYDEALSEDYLKKLRDIGFTRVLDEYKYPSAKSTGPHLHAALANGGITMGPSLAGEAGPEAVVPLPNGRSIPVILGENGIFKEMLDELQAMRLAMESGLGVQRKQLQFARN